MPFAAPLKKNENGIDQYPDGPEFDDGAKKWA
jgi:hypothetical protein